MEKNKSITESLTKCDLCNEYFELCEMDYVEGLWLCNKCEVEREREQFLNMREENETDI